MSTSPSLSRAQLNALRLARSGRLVRVTNGFRVRGGAFVRLDTARVLVERGLAHTPLVNNKHELVLTKAGREALAREDRTPAELRKLKEQVGASFRAFDRRIEQMLEERADGVAALMEARS